MSQDKNKYKVTEFKYDTDIWDTLKHWAKKNNFMIVKFTKTTRTYFRPGSLFYLSLSSHYIELEKKNFSYILYAWTKYMGKNSVNAGLIDAIGRRMLRGNINKFLDKLDVPPI